MSVPVLVVTPNAGFGELVGQILSETGDYILSMASNPDDALAVMGAQKPILLILEVNGDTEALPKIGEKARELVPELLTILIMQGELSEDESVAAFEPDGVLSKPVYLPDLVSKVEDVINKSDLENLEQVAPAAKVVRATVPQVMGEKDPPPEWLSDVNVAAQHLTRLSLESSAQASLITKESDIWAYAGELPQPAAEELARTVSEHFEDGGGSDLARFVKLEETDSEYMLYATGLGGEFVLATVFDAEMPFSKIRAQASNLAVALSTPPAPVIEEEPVEEYSEEDMLEEDEGEMELWPLLDDVPPPIPTDWVPEKTVKKDSESLLEELLEDSQQDEFSTETVAMRSSPQPAVVQDESESQQPMIEETVVSKSTQRAAKQVEDTTKASSLREFDEEGLPIPEPEFEVEPVSPSMYNLTYACVLIPRFPHHHLTGEFAKRLTDWITHLCVAFGWRLEQLSIRPDYMQWLVNVPPNTSPGYLMRTIREHTSRRMFVEFPVTEEDNPSGDFWAPGYLILGSPQPPPASLVQEFMQNTRSRQGLQEERPS